MATHRVLAKARHEALAHHGGMSPRSFAMPPHSAPSTFLVRPGPNGLSPQAGLRATSHNAAARLAHDGQRPQFKRTLLKLRLQTSANR
jgi:hypothetical protein